jgi:hypothetical protein
MLDAPTKNSVVFPMSNLCYRSAMNGLGFENIGLSLAILGVAVGVFLLVCFRDRKNS